MDGKEERKNMRQHQRILLDRNVFRVGESTERAPALPRASAPLVQYEHCTFHEPKIGRRILLSVNPYVIVYASVRPSSPPSAAAPAH
mmetsp:Transcript_5359/g.17367  ORF Transcript_5359/g.17367 Transcript_5359/m.17367 type:complete len:87 (+) Transcript_5359:1558-1818(+)